MKNDPDHDELLGDVLGASDEFRLATLNAGLRAAQRKRKRRALVRIGVPLLALLICAGVMSAGRTWRHPHRAVPGPLAQAPATSHAQTIAGTPIRVLSDEELLNVFKDRPVALVGAPGQRRLVLLDETSPQ